MLSLAIESSCDETSLALLSGQLDSGLDYLEQINAFEVLGSLTSSQVQVHEQFGGVVPEVGARRHAEQIHWLFQELVRSIKDRGQSTEERDRRVETEIIQNSKFKIQNENDILSQIQQILVTSEPGLISALRVGMEFGKSLRFFLEKKFGHPVELDYVNHLQGHVTSCFYKRELVKDQQGFLTSSGSKILKQVQDDKLLLETGNIFPHLHLLVSGGNTQLILLSDQSNWEIVGKTLDDAAGECLDKIGRMLGLPYPGGVHLGKIAGLAEENYFDFPVSMNGSDSLDFSYSGLKTALRYFLQSAQIPEFEIERPLSKSEVAELKSKKVIDSQNDKLIFIKKVAISVQFVVARQLINQLNKAVKKVQPNSIGLSGGVSANSLLRQKIQNLNHAQTLIAPQKMTGDNAVMIALAGMAKKTLAKTKKV